MNKVKRLADMALLLALGMIANLVSLPVVGNFGRISFVYGAAYISGIFLGPLPGMLITWIADLIPALVAPQGAPYNPIIGLGTAMISLIVGLANKYLPFKFHTRLIIGAFISYIVCTCGITAYGEVPLFYIYPYAFAKSIGKTFNISSEYGMLALSKMITQPVWITLNVAVTTVLCYRLSKIIDRRYGNVIHKERKTLKAKIAEPEVIKGEE